MRRNNLSLADSALPNSSEVQALAIAIVASGLLNLFCDLTETSVECFRDLIRRASIDPLVRSIDASRRAPQEVIRAVIVDLGEEDAEPVATRQSHLSEPGTGWASYVLILASVSYIRL
jgi:hypothetical protein